MPIKPEQLPAHLERGLAPVYLVGGPEPLLVEECRDQVCQAARDQGFAERILLQVERGFDWSELGAAGGTPSLFSSRRIVDLRMPTGKPGQAGARALVEWTAEPDPDLLLVVSCEQWDKGSRSSRWAAALDKAGVRIDVWPVRPADLPRWIQARMRARGLEPDREAMLMLAGRLEGNLLAARQEIEKLALLKGSGRVSEEDVLQAVADSSRFDAFLLVERILAGDLGESLRVALGLRRTGTPLQLVTGALFRELRTLEAFRLARKSGTGEDQAFRRLNVWRNRQAPMRQAAGRLGARRLYAAFRALSLIDRQSKGQDSGDAWHSLDRLVCDLCAR